ncbi:Tripartite motif-containing protein 59 [Armadillidium nasatum]|uniref:Tripartite motif-containing protein 59 n=1 Tax=Armadillidium nasatum TaxID=96803 RepID=A0A5N5SKH6_9CRUS|nr:Tripartite motif-containing protein 59 [Armadillidium nasatum]
MEYIVSCEICSLEYSDTETIPRVLDCGHSFCTSCIAQLENTLCPKCRANIPSGKEFPVNFSLLSLVEEWKSEKNLSPDIISSIQNLKEKLVSKLSVINKMFEICNTKESIESDIKLLTSMEEERLKEEFGSKKQMMMRKKLEKLEEKYKECSFVNYVFFDDLDKFSLFSLQNDVSSDTFFSEMYKILKSSEKIFTYKCINKELKFGELTVRDNKIMIHSLTLNEIPKGSKIVQFQNLRAMFMNKRLDAFFEITAKNGTSYTIIIQLHDRMLVPHFIKLCTAEKGSTYKNLPFSKGKNNTTRYDAQGRQLNYQQQVISLESILEVVSPKILLLDYYKNILGNLPCVENDVIVTETTDNGFHILRVKQPNSYTILGKVTYPSDLWNCVTFDNVEKILDCGLVTDV